MDHRFRSTLGTLRMLAGVLTLGTAGATASGMLAGCGAAASSGPNCSLTQAVFPVASVADHLAAAPGDKQAFEVGYYGNVPFGCAIPAVVAGPQSYLWVSSDPLNAPISNAKDVTAGVATCVGATTATISTTPVSAIKSATLTCK